MHPKREPGDVLIQKSSEGREKTVTYASKSLTAAETRYANTEKEMLAVVFGSTRFHHYMYGQMITCQSDHKPLEDIHPNHLSDASPRLQRLLLKIQPDNVDINYIPGTKI